MEDVFSCPLVYLSGWNIIFSEVALCSLHSTPLFYWIYFQERLMYLSASGDEKWLQSCAFVCWQLSGCTIVDSIGQSRVNQTLPTFFRSQRQAEPSSCLPACHLPRILILNNSACNISACIPVACIPVCLFVWALSTHRTLHSRWLQMKGPLPIPLHVIMHLLMSTLIKILIFRKIWSNFT